MNRTLALAVLTLLLAAPAVALGQNFSGSYAMRLPNGGAITISLSQDQTGHATGTMTGNGNTFPIDARIQNKNLVGKAGAVYFEAALEGSQIEVVMADFTANGQPDYAHARQMIFERQGDATASQAGAPTGGNPLAPASSASDGNPLARAAAPDPWLGTFLNSQIAFTVIPGQGGAYQGNMQVGAQDYPFTAQKANGGLNGSFRSGGQTYTFQATLSGNTLSLVSSGQTNQLERRGTSGSGAAMAAGLSGSAAAGPAGQPDMDQASQQLTQLLTSSSWCSFSYSATSGSSSTSKNTFRHDGILVVGTGHEGGTMNQYGGTTVAGGSFYSQQQGGGQAQWRVQAGQLMVNVGNGWQPLPLKVELNSAGNPIITAGGKEYMRC